MSILFYFYSSKQNGRTFINLGLLIPSMYVHVDETLEKAKLLLKFIVGIVFGEWCAVNQSRMFEITIILGFWKTFGYPFTFVANYFH